MLPGASVPLGYFAYHSLALRVPGCVATCRECRQWWICRPPPRHKFNYACVGDALPGTRVAARLAYELTERATSGHWRPATAPAGAPAYGTARRLAGNRE